MSRALVIAEPGLDVSGLIELARGAADEVHVLALSEPGQVVVLEGAADGTTAVAGTVLRTAEGAVSAIAAAVAAQGATVVVLPSTHRFREVTALLTATLGAACAPDAVAMTHTAAGIYADRLLYGGVAIATVALQRDIAVLTGRVGQAAVDGPTVTPSDATSGADVRKQLISRQPLAQEGDLSSATRIVSFGRGIRSKDDMAMVERLATVLGAEIGCSRPIVDDLKWLDLSHQVGLTGTVVQPDLYLAIGISGQIQHLVGMRDSRFIVAINNNSAAPIFDAADLAVVGDLYEIVPKLADALTNR